MNAPRGAKPTGARALGPMPRAQVGALVGAGPGVLLALLDGRAATGWLWWVAALVAALVCGGAVAARRWPLGGRAAVTAAWAVVGAFAAGPALASPMSALVLALGLGWGVVWVWNLTAAPAPASDRAVDAVIGAGVGAAALWCGALLLGMEGAAAVSATVASAALGWAVAARWLWRLGWMRGRGGAAVGAVALGWVALCLWLLPPRLWSVALMAPLWLLSAWLYQRAEALARSEDRRASSLLLEVLSDPGRNLVATFLVIGLGGGLVLSSPLCAAREPDGVPLLDAMFTAFSAACVTGLAVLDTPNDFSALGQAVILLLIQVGGLGIMTFSTAGLALLGHRLSLRHEATVAELLSVDSRRDLHAELRRVLAVTFGVEAAGALLLSAQFLWAGEALGPALWRGVFTSISAFCNAGFALQSDSLIPYQQSPWVLHTVALIIIAGSFGPAVVLAIPSLLRGRCRAPNLRVVWHTTLWLLFVPALLIFAWESQNTLAHLPWADAATNAWFQSVTLRTAGFNSIDLAAAQPATLSLMMALMFIGGSPGSTAGGLKTTNFALMLLALRASLRGQDEVHLLGFRIPRRLVFRVFTVGLVGLLSVFGLLLMLQLTQTLPLHSALFESISALATVGLSVGATAALDSVGKVAIIIAMFAGRVGPLTLFVVLASRAPTPERALPAHDLPIG